VDGERKAGKERREERGERREEREKYSECVCICIKET